MLQESGRPSVKPPSYERAVGRSANTDPELSALVRAGAAGDPSALTRLVARFDGLLRGVARSYRLTAWDTDDVIQATWLQFMQHGRQLREPAAVSGWLATTARRYSLRILQRHVREDLRDDPACGERSGQAEPDHELIAAERRALLQRALADLPRRQRELMRVLTANPDLSYEEVGRLLSMPIGSIGPTRARSLDRLSRDGGLQALHAACAA
jgi:RNA polymerase sigma factor (sigma-70 family)